MSKARSPRLVCSITIGTSGLTIGSSPFGARPLAFTEASQLLVVCLARAPPGRRRLVGLADLVLARGLVGLLGLVGLIGLLGLVGLRRLRSLRSFCRFRGLRKLPRLACLAALGGL